MLAKAQTRPIHSRRGFSLLELMLVLGILGVLMAVAAVNVLGGQERANIRATQASMRTVSQAIESYKLNTRAFPATLASLTTGGAASYLSSVNDTKDAWGNELYYTSPGYSGRPYTLISNGPDGEPETDDDIDYWVFKDADLNQPADGA